MLSEFYTLIKLRNMLSKLYTLVESNSIDNSIDLIFSYFDKEFNAGNFYDCNEVLKNAEVSRLEVNTIIAILSITLAAKDKLPARLPFLNRARKKLLETETSDRVKRLLSGLV